MTTRPLIDRMAEALKECQRSLSIVTNPENIKTTTVLVAWAKCASAEITARALLSEYDSQQKDTSHV